MKISIVMPSYNQAGYIREAIESVLSQEVGAEVELIVVDGASTDGTVEILRDYGERIRWTSEPDQGQADALNKGLARATGDIIGWLNSDDLHLPGAYTAVARVFASEPRMQWLYGKVRIIDPAGREIRRWITAYKNWRMRRYSFARLLAENWVSQMGVFWRRDFGGQVGPFRADLHYCMDYNYWLRMGALVPGRFVDQYLGAFRWYPQSKSGAGFGRQFAEELAVAREIAAGRYRWALLTHRFNYHKIVAAYTLMRWLRR